MNQLDEQTHVPLKSVVAILGFILTIGTIGVWRTAFWVSHVDEKLQTFDGRVARIEQAMHINSSEQPEAVNENPFVNEAQAQAFRIINSESPSGKRERNGTGR